MKRRWSRWNNRISLLKYRARKQAVPLRATACLRARYSWEYRARKQAEILYATFCLRARYS